MRTITRATLALTGAAALTLFAVVPANAVDTVTVAIEVGDLAIVTDALGAALADATPGAPIVGTITGVAVTDARATTGVWAVSVNATAFVNEETPASSASMTGAGITYTVGEIVETGAPVITNVTPDVVLAVAPAEVATATVAGNNTATWDADLSVAVPLGALGGTYSTTITHSILPQP